MSKHLIKFISRLFPGLVASYAYQQLTSPQVRKLRDHELAILDKADKETLAFKGFDIQLYHWPGGEKRVLLIHGWEGQAGNFSDFIEPLLAEGYSVFAFDGPSHGFSSKGSTSMFEFIELVGLLIQKFEVKRLVSHSFGGVATTFALYDNQDLYIDSYAMITTPDRFSERIDDVASSAGISNRAKNRLINRLKQEIDRDIDALNVSDFVPSINVKKALIFHDKNDKVIPIEISRRVHENWPASSFKEIEGTGHFRILRTPEVIDEVVAFLA
ncbi:MAG: alpha/beta hydrolase [Bacteroidota bacterium]